MSRTAHTILLLILRWTEASQTWDSGEESEKSSDATAAICGAVSKWRLQLLVKHHLHGESCIAA